jgi:hypothetical protein
VLEDEALLAGHLLGVDLLLGAAGLAHLGHDVALGLLVLQHGLPAAPVQQEVEHLLPLRRLEQLPLPQAQLPRHVPHDPAEVEPKRLE